MTATTSKTNRQRLVATSSQTPSKHKHKNQRHRHNPPPPSDVLTTDTDTGHTHTHSTSTSGGVKPQLLRDGQTMFLEFETVIGLKAHLDRPHVFYEGGSLSGPLRGVNFPLASLFHWFLVELRRSIATHHHAATAAAATIINNTNELGTQFNDYDISTTKVPDIAPAAEPMMLSKISNRKIPSRLNLHQQVQQQQQNLCKSASIDDQNDGMFKGKAHSRSSSLTDSISKLSISTAPEVIYCAAPNGCSTTLDSTPATPTSSRVPLDINTDVESNHNNNGITNSNNDGTILNDKQNMVDAASCETHFEDSLIVDEANPQSITQKPLLLSVSKIFSNQELWVIDELISSFYYVFPYLKDIHDNNRNPSDSRRYELLDLLDLSNESTLMINRVCNVESILSSCLATDLDSSKFWEFTPDTVATANGVLQPLASTDYLSNIWDFSQHQRQFSLYVIAYLKPDKSTILHEWCHSVFYLDPNYSSLVMKIWESDYIPEKTQTAIIKELSLRGYKPEFYCDEFQAYIVETPAEFGKRNTSLLYPLHIKFKKYLTTPNPQPFSPRRSITK